MDVSREDLDALLGAYAIDALDADERDAVDALVSEDADLAQQVRRFQEAAVGLLGPATDHPAPTTLRADVLERAIGTRTPGRHLGNPLGPDLPAGELWARQFADLDAVLDRLGDDDWAAITSFDRSVHVLLAHLTAVFDLFAQDLGAGSFEVPEGTPIGHWELTEPRIAELSARAPAVTVQHLRATASRIGAALDARSPAELAGMLVEGGVLTVTDRTRQQCFELWMHTDDIRQATGRPLLDPDAERVCALSDLSARFLGLGMAVSGVDHDGSWGRLVLTGEGGGTWRTPLGLADGGAGLLDVAAEHVDDVTVVVDAIDYCRYVGNLLALDDLTYAVEGDEALGHDLLVGAQAFAE